MVKKYVFNRKKENTILLIHGLHTTSGFWLSYLPLFKNFKIIAFDINYDKLLLKEFYSTDIFNKEFSVDENVIGIISHSFGTVISDLLFEYNNANVYKICPIAFSKKNDSSNFILDIVNRTSLTEDKIHNNNKIASSFILRARNFINTSGHFYIPKNDCYFSYNVPNNDKIEFIGDHFNINNALLLIIEKFKG